MEFFDKKSLQKQPPRGVLKKGILRICSKFTGKHPCRSSFIEIILRHVSSPVNLLHIFETPFLKNDSYGLLLSLLLRLLITSKNKKKCCSDLLATSKNSKRTAPFPKLNKKQTSIESDSVDFHIGNGAITNLRQRTLQSRIWDVYILFSMAVHAITRLLFDDIYPFNSAFN